MKHNYINLYALSLVTSVPMVTIADIEKRREELRTQEKELDKVEREQKKLASTGIPQRRYGAGVTRETQAIALQKRRVGRQNLENIKKSREDIKTARGQLDKSERQLRILMAEQRVLQEEKARIEYERKLAGRGAEGSLLLREFGSKETRRILEREEELQEKQKALTITTTYIEAEKLPGVRNIDVVTPTGAESIKITGSKEIFDTPVTQILKEIDIIKERQKKVGTAQRLPPVTVGIIETPAGETTTFKLQGDIPQIRGAKEVISRPGSIPETISVTSVVTKPVETVKKTKLQSVREAYADSIYKITPSGYFLSGVYGDKGARSIRDVTLSTTKNKLRTANKISVFPGSKYIGKIGTGALLPDNSQQLAEQTLLFGGAYVLGAGTSVVSQGSTRLLSKVTSPLTASKIVGVTEGITLGGAGAYATYEAGKDVIKSDQKLEEIGKLSREFLIFGGGFYLGRQKGEVLASRLFERGRTVKIPLENIEARERIELGQTYPKVKRGQTVRELKQEFFKNDITEFGEGPTKIINVENFNKYTGFGGEKPIILDIGGEIKPIELISGFGKPPTIEAKAFPKGFSSRALPLGNEIPTSRVRRADELRGLYISPELNPEFLRINTRSPKLFGLEFGVSTPLVIRTYSERLKLIPGLKPTDIIPTKPKINLKEFSGLRQGSGETFIGGEKTEKQAVIIFGSQFEYISKGKYYTEVTTSGGKLKVPIDIISISEKGKPKSTGIFSKPSKALPISQPYIQRPLISEVTLGSYGITKSLYSSSLTPPTSNLYASYSSKVYRGIPGYTKSSYNYSPKRSISGTSSISRVKPRYTTTSITPSYSYIPGDSYTKIPDKIITEIPTEIKEPPRTEEEKRRGGTILPGLNFGVGKDLTTGYRTFVIRGGKKQFLPGVLPKGLALRKGAEKTKLSLRATFGVTPTQKLVRKRDISFQPSKKIFREYKIKGGRKVKTPGVFIQRTRKEGGLPGGRLSFRSEVSKIQQARSFKI